MGRRTIGDLAHALLFAGSVAVIGCSGGGDDGGGSGGGDGDGDGDTSGPPSVCEDNNDCTDDVFCNGEERCNPDHKDADAFGCLEAADEPCSDGNSCNESDDECGCEDPDSDGDGHDSETCGGDDCDDDDSNRYPGNGEVCDGENHDEDCNPNTYGFRDQDGDDDPDDECCNEDESGDLICGTDCNDNRGNQHSFNTEICDDIDNDCDGLVDESPDGDEDDGLKKTFTVDLDNDGRGSDDPDADSVFACEAPEGYVDTADDCDDDDNQISPESTEVCDDVDNDCDGLTDETINGDEDDGLKTRYTIDEDDDGYAPDGDGLDTVLACSKPDNYAAPLGDCEPDDPDINPGRVDVCSDDIDNDCSDVVNDPIGGCICEGNDSRFCSETGLLGQCGKAVQNCNDGVWDDCPTEKGDNPEVCDVAGEDEDCDGFVNEVTGLYEQGTDPQDEIEINDSLKETYYRDRDGDGYPNLSQSAQYCPDLEPAGWITDENPNDCVDVLLTNNPRSADIHPGAVEVCNGVNDDCDNATDELADLEDPPSPPNASALMCGGDDGWEITGCSGSYLDCETDTLSDGCETPGNTLQNCGSCGNSCSFSCQNDGGWGCVELTAVVAGSAHTCGVLEDGTAACWGNGAEGRLGYGDTDSVTRPEPVSLLSNVSQIAGGGAHSCAINGAQDNLFCWGSNSSGQLGVGLSPDPTDNFLLSLQPMLVAGSGYDQVSAGDLHTCAVRGGGNLVCWGAEQYGRLGNGGGSPTTKIVSPVNALDINGPTISDASMVAAGGFHTCYLSMGGSVFCAGRDHLGQLGTDEEFSTTYPEYFHEVGGLSSVTHLSAGRNHNCAVSDGEVWCWGSNSQGQIGQALMTASASTPVKVPGISNVTLVAAGIAHTCVLSGGEVYCWGQGTKGQLGIDTDLSTSPVKAGERGAEDLLGACDLLTASGYHTCARESSSLQVKCWGADDNGQLGDGAAGAGEDNDPDEIEPLN